MSPFKQGVLWVLLLLLGPASKAFAAPSLIHETTDLMIPPRSSVQTHFEKNAWIYTKLDNTGFHQVYYQYLDPSLTNPDLLQEVRLTTSSYNKFQAQFGAKTERLRIFQTTGSTLVDECNNGQLFYYLADEVPSNGRKEIHVGCFTNFLSTTPSIHLDTKLTEWGATSTFEIAQFDAHHIDSGKIHKSGTPPSVQKLAFSVVFTTARGNLHFLMHDATRINLDATNMTDQLIVIDYTDPIVGYDWQFFLLNHFFQSYRSASFDVFGNNIIYLGKLPMGTNFEIGTIHKTGTLERQITALNAEISNPRFHDTKTNSLPHDIVHDLFFTYTLSGINRISHLKTQTTDGGTVKWCTETNIITTEDHSRQNYRTKFIQPGMGTKPGNTFLAYELTQDDGINDIYQKDLELPICTTAPSTAPVTTIVDLSHLYRREKQLTCVEDNTAPAIVPDIFYDEFFVPFAYSPKGFTDIIFSRNYIDGAGSSIGHIYNVENSTGECEESTPPPKGGSPEETSSVTTSNYFLDEEEEPIEEKLIEETSSEQTSTALPPPDADPTAQESSPLDGAWLFSGSNCSLTSSPTKTNFSFLSLILISLLGIGLVRFSRNR